MDRINHWLDQFEGRSLRERGTLLAALLVVLLFVSYQFVIAPLLIERNNWIEKTDQSRQKTAQAVDQLARLEAALKFDPDRDNSRRLEQIKAESTRLDSRLRQEQQTMISAQMMPVVLQDVLADLPLVLISLRKLPPEVEIDSEIEGVPTVYRHGLRLELEGSYSDTLVYIERLEELTWSLAWEALDISMKEYPQARIATAHAQGR